MDHGLFFSQKNLENGHIVRCYKHYTHYFQESIWMLKQKFWAKLVKKSGWVSGPSLSRALTLQQGYFAQGSEVHLGGILLQEGFLSTHRLSYLLQEMGDLLLFCPECKIEFYREVLLLGKEHLCPICEASLRSYCEKKLPVQALRAGLWSPRILPSTGKEDICQDDFLFLDVSEYLGKNLSQLEQEIALILNSFDYWIATILGREEPGKPYPDARGECKNVGQDPMAITGAISQKLLALNISNASLKAVQSDLDLDLPVSLIPLFWGYMHNLYELLWFLRQQVFAKICLQRVYININQIQQAFEVEERAFHRGKMLPIASTLVQIYLLSEEQVMNVLQDMGEQVYSCSGCHLILVQRMQATPACPICGQMFTPASPSSVQRAVCANFFPTVPLNLASEGVFVFYKSRSHYRPRFSLEERDAAYRALSLQEEISELETSFSDPEKASVEESPHSHSSQEIKEFMDSMGNIATEEGIYDRYVATRQEEGEKREDDDLPPHSQGNGESQPFGVASQVLMAFGKLRDAVPTALETIPSSILHQNISASMRIAVAALGSLALVFIAFLLISGLEGKRDHPSLSPLEQTQKTSAPPTENSTTSTPLGDRSESPKQNLSLPPPVATESGLDVPTTSPKSGTIAGKVNLHGQTLPGLKIVASSLSSEEENAIVTFEIATALCAKDGSFSFKLPAGKYRLQLVYENYLWPPSPPIWVRAGEHSNASLEMPPLGSIQGMIPIHPQRPMPSTANISLLNKDNQQVVERKIEISANGEFEVESIDPGTYLVTLSLPTFDPTPEQKMEIEISPGIQKLVEFRWDLATIEGFLQPAEASLRLRLTLEEITIAPNGKITLTPVKTAQPDENGHFTFTAIKPGTYLIVARGESAVQSVEVSVGPYDHRQVALRLNDNHIARVQVRYKNGPISGAKVVARSKPYGEIMRKAVTDKRGEADLISIPAGDYTVLADYRLSPGNRELKGTALLTVPTSAPLVIALSEN